MNHRVSIVVSNTSTESGLGSPEVCSNFGKPAAAASQNQSKRMCALPFFFFIVEPCAEFTCYSPLVLCHSFSFSGQRSTVVPGHARTKHSSPWIGSFRPFLLALFFFFFSCQLTIHSRALRLSVCCELQAADEKKSDSLTSQYPHGERMFEEGKSTNRIVHVVFPYTFRRPALRFRSFSTKRHTG